MKRRNTKSTGKSLIVPLRVPEDMQDKIRSLSGRARLSDADIMRMAIDRGLNAVEKMFEPEETKAA